jgi:STIP1 family protein 1
MPNASKIKEIPSFLKCHITLEMMEEPVTTEAGFSYEKNVIEDHIKLNGPTDPMTRR